MSKHFIAAGAAAVAILAVVAVASAQGALKTYTDPQNRFSFQYPASLPLDVVARPNQPVNVLVGAAAYECQIFVVERADTAGKPADALVRGYSPPLSADVWKTSADGFRLYQQRGTVQSNTSDTSKFWPVQRASMRTGDSTPVVAAMQARPGVDVWQFCTAFDDGDHTTVFNQIINSFAGPEDAAQQAAAEAALAQRGAAAAAAQAAADAAAAAAAAAPKQQQKKASRGRGLKEKN